MEKPTKEEVGELKARLSKDGIDGLLNLEILDLIEAYLALMEEVKTERAERIKWQRIRKPTHGTCCTCQRCGLDHDSCRCDLDDVVDELEQLQAKNQALKATMDNIYGNIKSLPAGHERYALDCIRKLLKPMEQERMGNGEDV